MQSLEPTQAVTKPDFLWPAHALSKPGTVISKRNTISFNSADPVTRYRPAEILVSAFRQSCRDILKIFRQFTNLLTNLLTKSLFSSAANFCF